MSTTTASSATPISPLRRRMIEDMTVRGIGEKSQSDYIRQVKNFTMFLGRCARHGRGEDLRRYQVHQRETGRSAADHEQCGLGAAVLLPDDARPAGSGAPPAAGDPAAASCPMCCRRTRCWLCWRQRPGRSTRPPSVVAYGAGLRVSEVANLKVSDIDSKRMLLRIEQGKGQKDRNGDAVAAAVGAAAGVVAGRSSRRRGCSRAAIRCCRSRRASCVEPVSRCGRRGRDQDARHRRTRSGTRSPTHLLEQGVDIRVIQVALETTTNCPPTAGRGPDHVSVPSAMRRNGACFPAIRLSRD